ncbi:MAG: hypothetical protein QOJ50_247, partial [Cryptosporangiaceae bacterium]|nr:hypothetical protein [Cryptosporangiaceae bacterium]
MRRALSIARFAGPAGLALFAGLVAPGAGTAGAADAATAPTVTISGKLAGQTGMTVLAVSPNGRAMPAKLNSAGVFSFRLAPAAAHDLTLQLVDAHGRYAGPVVLTRASGKAYTALAGTAVDLGSLHPDSGWAWVSRAMPRGTVDAAKWARADSHGKPAGAGKLGFVRTAGAHARITSGAPPATAPAAGPGADPDSDGIPTVFDADANGNGVLDRVDPAAPASPGIDVRVSTALAATFGQTVNANAGPVTSAQLDALLTGDHTFAANFYVSEMGLDRSYSGIDVNCFTLTYCAPGTGTATMDGMDDHGVPFSPTAKWADYNTDGSGLPNLTHYPSQHSWSVNVLPHVNSANIHPGDTFEVNLRAGTDVVTAPRSLSTYFVTTPAITQWANGTGAPASVTYPVTSEATSQLSATSGRLTLSFWQPQ